MNKVNIKDNNKILKELESNQQNIIKELKTLNERDNLNNKYNYNKNFYNNPLFKNTYGQMQIQLPENEILTINEIIEKLIWNRNQLHNVKMQLKRKNCEKIK